MPPWACKTTSDYFRVSEQIFLSKSTVVDYVIQHELVDFNLYNILIKMLINNEIKCEFDNNIP